MDLGYFRWDYVTLAFDMESDRFHLYLQVLDGLGASHFQPEEWKRSERVKVHRSTTEGHNYYTINISGRCANVVNYLPIGFHPFVTRLDIKSWPEGYTMDDLHCLRAEILNKPCGYNITTHDGKLRQKTDKRDAGGTSLAIGSHKSDLRVSLYGRGHEAVCIEFQVSGDMLRRVRIDVASDENNRQSPAIFWGAVKDRLQQLGVCRYNRALDNAGISQWRPTTEDERYAAFLDSTANDAERGKITLHRQEQLDLAAGEPVAPALAVDPHTGEVIE